MPATAAEAKTTEPKADPYAKFGVMAGPLAELIPALKAKAVEHDGLVAQLSIKDGEISDDVREATRLANKSNNPDVVKLNANIAKLRKTLDEQLAQAYSLTESDLPKPPSEEEVKKIQERVKNLRSDFKSSVSSLQNLSKTFGLSESDLNEILPVIKTNGRVTIAGTSTRAGHHGPRLHFSNVYVDDKLAEMKKPGTDPVEMTSSLSAAANEISKAVKSKVSASELQTAYFAAVGSEDFDSAPNVQEFKFVYKSGDREREFTLRAEK